MNCPGPDTHDRVLSSQKRDQVEPNSEFGGRRGQAYWICTLVEDSEHLAAQAAETSHAWLAQHLPNLNIGWSMDG